MQQMSAVLYSFDISFSDLTVMFAKALTKITNYDQFRKQPRKRHSKPVCLILKKIAPSKCVYMHYITLFVLNKMENV